MKGRPVEYQLNEVEEQINYGLRCPDGSVIWPPDTYKGYPINTEQERNDFANILVGAAQELKINPTVFVSAFAWVPRQSITYVISKVPDQVIEMGHQWPIEEQEQEEPVDGEPPELNE